MPRGRKSICPSALQEFVEGVDTFSATTDDLLDLPSPPMRKSRNRRRSISTTPIKSKFRDAFVVSASLACLASEAEFETANFFVSAKPPVPVRAEFSPLDEEISVLDITQASPLREVTNIDTNPRGKHAAAKNQQRAWTFSLADVQQVAAKPLDDEYHLRILHNDNAFVLICPRQPELTGYLTDCELIQKGGPADPAENIVPQEQLDQFFDDIDCTSQAHTPAKGTSEFGDDSFMQDEDAGYEEEQSEDSKDAMLRLAVREFVKGTGLWDQTAMRHSTYDEIYLPFQQEHEQIFTLYEYPIVSRFRLEGMRVNPTTRDGKMAILQRIGVEKLISQNSQRAQQDLELEKSLGVQAKKKAWGFDYVDLQSRQKLAFEEWSQRYMTHIGKECGCIEVSEWDNQFSCYRSRVRPASDWDAMDESTVCTPASARQRQAVTENNTDRMQRHSPKVLVRVSREQRKSPALAARLATPPPPHVPTSPIMTSSASKKLTINTACPTPPPAPITDSPYRNQAEKRSPSGFRQRLEFTIQSADDQLPVSPQKKRQEPPVQSPATPVQKRPQTPVPPESPAPSPPNQSRTETSPKTPSPRERRLVAAGEQSLAQPTFTSSPLVDRVMSNKEQTQPAPRDPQPVVRAPPPKKIPASTGVAEKARNAIEQRLWDRWELALRQYNWELVTEEAIQRANQLFAGTQ